MGPGRVRVWAPYQQFSTTRSRYFTSKLVSMTNPRKQEKATADKHRGKKERTRNTEQETRGISRGLNRARPPRLTHPTHTHTPV